MASLLRQVLVDELPTRRYTLTSPLQVAIYEDECRFRAVAPELGMWVDGFGTTEATAISELIERILEQRESVDQQSASECFGYARAIKRAFEERLIEG